MQSIRKARCQVLQYQNIRLHCCLLSARVPEVAGDASPANLRLFTTMSLPPLDGGHGGGGAHVGVVEVGAAALAAGVEDPAAVVVPGTGPTGAMDRPLRGTPRAA